MPVAHVGLLKSVHDLGDTKEFGLNGQYWYSSFNSTCDDRLTTPLDRISKRLVKLSVNSRTEQRGSQSDCCELC